MNRSTTALLLAVSLALQACAARQSEKPAAAVIGTVSVEATIDAIDYPTRHITLRGEEGKLLTLKVGEYAHNFDQLKVGDKVKFDYTEAVALAVTKADGDLGTDSEVTMARAPLGATPGAVIAETRTGKARVEDIDYATRHVSLRAADGNLITLKVGDEVQRLEDVKKGDYVVVQYTEALGISVTQQ